MVTLVKGEVIGLRVKETATAIGLEENHVRSLLLKHGGQQRLTARFRGNTLPKKCVGLPLGVLNAELQRSVTKGMMTVKSKGCSLISVTLSNNIVIE